MPKNRKIVKIANAIHKLRVPATLRIGTRKSGTSAHRMSTDALKAVLETAGQKRWHQNALSVLALRGVTV